MKFLGSAAALLTLSGADVLAHPGRPFVWGADKPRGAELAVVGRSTDRCADAIHARGNQAHLKRAARLMNRRLADGKITRDDIAARNELKYPAVRNHTSLLVPDSSAARSAEPAVGTVRHDVREDQPGVDLYLDIGVIDLHTCEPITDARLTISSCDATGAYPDAANEDDTFLRGTQVTDEDGIVEFLTLFPGAEDARTTHVRIAVQPSAADGDSSSPARHVGRVFFSEDLIREVHAYPPYAMYQDELSRLSNEDDAVYKEATADGHSAIVSVERLGDDLDAGLIGYVTLAIDTAAKAAPVASPAAGHSSVEL